MVQFNQHGPKLIDRSANRDSAGKHWRGHCRKFGASLELAGL